MQSCKRFRNVMKGFSKLTRFLCQNLVEQLNVRIFNYIVILVMLLDWFWWLHQLAIWDLINKPIVYAGLLGFNPRIGWCTESLHLKFSYFFPSRNANDLNAWPPWHPTPDRCPAPSHRHWPYECCGLSKFIENCVKFVSLYKLLRITKERR